MKKSPIDDSAACPSPIDDESACRRMELDRDTYLLILGDSIVYLRDHLLRLHEAVARSDRRQISDLAHAIASNAGNLGMVNVHDDGRRLEHVADGDEEGDIATLFDRLESSVKCAAGYGETLIQAGQTSAR